MTHDEIRVLLRFHALIDHVIEHIHEKAMEIQLNAL